MSGSGRRGRRGGRRQRRREELGRQADVSPAPAAAPEGQTNGQSGPGHPVIEPAAAPEPAHPRPLSARELVARLEALRAHEEAADARPPADAPAPADGLLVEEATEAPASFPVPVVTTEPRRFAARGTEWIARIAGRGTGGTGRVAPARVGAIQFTPVAQPEGVSAEVITAHAHLDDLYDEELAELLERGLRLKGNA